MQSSHLCKWRVSHEHSSLTTQVRSPIRPRLILRRASSWRGRRGHQNPWCTHSFILTKLQKLNQAVASMMTLLQNNPHICTTLYKYSLQHYSWHLLPTNILHFQNSSTHQKYCNTDFITNINTTTKTFLSKMISDPDTSEPTPAHAWCIATTPTGLGGLGFEDLSAKAIKCFITPIARLEQLNMGLSHNK